MSMTDARRYAVWPDPRSSQGHEPLKVRNPSIFKSCLLQHLQWELATDHGFLNHGTISKFDRAGLDFLNINFVLVCVSRDFEFGRNVSCEESTVSPEQGYFYFCYILGY